MLGVLQKKKSRCNTIEGHEEVLKFEKDMEAIFKDAIYLIMPKKFKSDTTYNFQINI